MVRVAEPAGAVLAAVRVRVVVLLVVGIATLGLPWILIWLVGGQLRRQALMARLPQKLQARLNGAAIVLDRPINGDGPNGILNHTKPTTNGDEHPPDGAPKSVIEK